MMRPSAETVAERVGLAQDTKYQRFWSIYLAKLKPMSVQRAEGSAGRGRGNCKRYEEVKRKKGRGRKMHPVLFRFVNTCCSTLSRSRKSYCITYADQVLRMALLSPRSVYREAFVARYFAVF